MICNHTHSYVIDIYLYIHIYICIYICIYLKASPLRPAHLSLLAGCCWLAAASLLAGCLAQRLQESWQHAPRVVIFLV